MQLFHVRQGMVAPQDSIPSLPVEVLATCLEGGVGLGQAEHGLVCGVLGVPILRGPCDELFFYEKEHFVGERKQVRRHRYIIG